MEGSLDKFFAITCGAASFNDELCVMFQALLLQFL